MTASVELRERANLIWQAGVDAVKPHTLIHQTFADASSPLKDALNKANRIIVTGAGKAGAAMAEAVESELAASRDRLEGVVNIPSASPDLLGPPNTTLQKIRLHVARPAATNQPTAEGVAGAKQILDLFSHAGSTDVALCLISGGGSALLPAPVEGVSLHDKQAVTKLLHECGATINEMNAVRKHLSRIKGGRLAQAFSGGALYSLIISDVIGDPLDAIASGPTAPDPTTFADALSVLQKYKLLEQVPAAVRKHLEMGESGDIPDTPKALPDNVHNIVLGNNAKALAASEAKAKELGYRVLNLGSFIEGETREVAIVLAGIARSIRHDHIPLAPPVCLLSGGETTVTLAKDHGLGGRNQEMILAMIHKLGPDQLAGVVLLSGGSDGEDGPTDAAGAIADGATLERSWQKHLNVSEYLQRNDAYHFFEQTGDLVKTGLTQTNVMDLRVMLVT